MWGTREKLTNILYNLTVHPRVCGELRYEAVQKQQSDGSSPRVWGTRSHPGKRADPCRFIPACVGNSPAVFRGGAQGPVHPRVCGELLSCHTGRYVVVGSSPRVWGTRRSGPPFRESVRFIPACVGNSGLSFSTFRRSRVHPRVCGELGCNESPHGNFDGSSPRVWGTLKTISGTASGYRFIPACVGNSVVQFLTGQKFSVHPRVCGELACSGTGPFWSTGSSPRVWGTPFDIPRLMCWNRFIPACVGNSMIRLISSCQGSVHPRVCGELPCPGTAGRTAVGSSPRVWGTHCRSGRPRSTARFIPACVGNSFAIFRMAVIFAVHPRVCGELATAALIAIT